MDFETMKQNHCNEKRILVSGCGAGKPAIKLAQFIPEDARVIAIDPLAVID